MFLGPIPLNTFRDPAVIRFDSNLCMANLHCKKCLGSIEPKHCEEMALLPLG